LLTNRDEMNILYRGPSIYASYKVSVHLAKRFQRRWFFQKSTNQKQELPMVAMFVNESRTYEQSLKRTYHRCFLPCFGSFDQAVSERKIFIEITTNYWIRYKNCLWWAYLWTDQDEMSNLYRGSSITASYQVSVHLAMQFQRRRFF
jgi:hypothetical protein